MAEMHVNVPILITAGDWTINVADIVSVRTSVVNVGVNPTLHLAVRLRDIAEVINLAGKDAQTFMSHLTSVTQHKGQVPSLESALERLNPNPTQ